MAKASLNQATIRRAGLGDSLEAATSAGFAAIGVWRESVAEVGLTEAARRLAGSGLRMSGLCRAGYFATGSEATDRAALDEALAAIEEARVLADAVPGSAPVVVLVAGGLPEGSRDLPGTRQRFRDAIGRIAPDAASAGVVLAIEALHPMMASDRGVVSTLRQAIDIAEDFGPEVGVVVDAYHVWWDPEVEQQIRRAGALGRIASVQVSDWATPVPEGALLGRRLMGEGVIDLPRLLGVVAAAGYTGDVEVEIFNAALWDLPAQEGARRSAAAFRAMVAQLAAG